MSQSMIVEDNISECYLRDKMQFISFVFNSKELLYRYNTMLKCHS